MRTAKNSFLQLIIAAWEACKGQRVRFFSFIILFALAYSFELFIPYTIGYIINVFTEKGFVPEAYRIAFYGVSAYIGLRLLSTALHHIARYIQVTVSYRARTSALNRVFRALLAFPLSWHIRHHSGELISKMHRSAGAVDTFVGQYTWQITESLVRIGGATVAIMTLDPYIAFLVLGLSIFSILAMIYFNRRVTDSIRERNRFDNRISQACFDFLSNIVTVKALNFEPTARANLERHTSEGYGALRSFARYNEFKWGVIDVGYAAVMGTSLSLYLYSNQQRGSSFNIGEIYVLLSLMERVFQAIIGFTSYYSGLIESYTSYQDGQEIIEGAEKLEATRVEQEHLHETPVNWTSIQAKSIKLTYHKREVYALDDVSFDMRRGERIALVGPTGGGKSSILKVLSGLIIPEQMDLSVDGRPITPTQLSDICLLIPQEPEIFSESMLYNLTMEKDIPLDEVKRVANVTQLTGLIQRLPQGLDTCLVERGLNLSGGERQRVAVARGLLCAPHKDVVLLDEPSSSLDVATERLMLKAVFDHFPHKTFIISLHRLRLIPCFDTVMFLNEGKLVERGSFDELIRKKGYFFKAWRDFESTYAADEETTPGNPTGQLIAS